MIFGDTIESGTELDSRSNDGIEVSLLWRPSDDQVFVRVVDARAGEQFEIFVDAEDALDAFQHPFAYAAWCGVDHAVCLPLPEAVLA